MSDAPLLRDETSLPQTAVGEAALTEAVRHVDVVHTSLMGMTAIVFMLLVAVALPVFGLPPVKQPVAFAVMALTAFIGIGGLYILNFRVHQHVTNQARLTEVLVNSLGQGFLVFGRSGICENVYSQACIDLLETIPAGKHVAEVLRIPEDQRSDFNDWLEILYQPDHALGFDDVVNFLPKIFPHSHDRRVTIVYRPIRGRDKDLVKVVVIATDQTEEFAARQQAKKQQNFAEMICCIFKERNQFYATLAHLHDFLDEAQSPNIVLKESAGLLRQLHTLKATVKQFNLIELGEIIHDVESELRDPLITDDAGFREALEAGRKKIGDALLKVTDEVVVLLGNEREWHGNVREVEEAELYAFAKELKKANVDEAVLQHYLSTIAAVPIRDCFRSFDRELHELAIMMDKQVKPVRFLGDNPRVLTQSMQEFLFSLTHICRNIMDHGIEPPVTRMARGKEPAGLVSVQTNIVPREDGAGDWLRIVIGDDGNGIDPSRVRAKLAQLDPDGNWKFEDDQTVIQRIFMWGVSTSDAITTLSGRGVGMEAVNKEVVKLGGKMRVASELYKGSSFEIYIPYRLAIAETENDSAKQTA
jgi:two-component system chemotaxis sensor kinase CheA